MARITFINSTGRGFAGEIEVADNTTVAQLFVDKVGGSAANYTITVNGEPVVAEQLVEDGDSVKMIAAGDVVSVTPSNIKGN